MNIITKDQLAETLLESILAPLYQEWMESGTDNFDHWMYENLAELGEAMYTEIGNRYGDCDGAANELL